MGAISSIALFALDRRSEAPHRQGDVTKHQISHVRQECFAAIQVCQDYCLKSLFDHSSRRLSRCLHVVRVIDLIAFVLYPVPWPWTRTQIRPHKPGWLNGRVQFLSLSLWFSMTICALFIFKLEWCLCGSVILCHLQASL